MSGAADDAAALAALMARGVVEGAQLPTLRAIAEAAGELGASRAMTRLGLADEKARADVAELRELLEAWRDAKRSAWRAGLRWAGRVVTAAVLAWLAMRLGFEGVAT
jgi:hypothetical protein